MKRSILFAAALTLSASVPVHAQFVVEKKWSFNHVTPTSAGRSSEIVTFDPLTNALWVVGGTGLDVLNLDGTRRVGINTTALGTVNSIAITGDVAAVSFSAASAGSDGTVQFFRTTDFISGAMPMPIRSVAVGAVPDMVTWTNDGRLLVANEGERVSAAVNPAGSVSILSFGPSGPSAIGLAASAPTVVTAGLAGVPLHGDVRIEPGVAAGVALEPEYIALDPKGGKAFVTLQEANAFGILNLQTNAFEKVVALGLKSFAAPGARLDPSDRDGPGGSAGFSLSTLVNGPIKGLYMPDTAASFVKDGKTYYVTANEGDTFVDDSDRIRIAEIPNSRLAAFGDDAAINALKATFGRLRVSLLEFPGTTPVTGLRMFGARSFSIWDENGQLVSDSGDMIDRMLAQLHPALYNDGRSPDRGVEPEGIAVKQIGSRIYAFVGLERTTRSVIAVFDITDVANPRFLQFIVGEGTERAPESLLLFEQNDLLYLALAQEDPSNITTLYQLTEIPEPSTYALMLAGLAALGLAARRRRGAPPLAA